MKAAAVFFVSVLHLASLTTALPGWYQCPASCTGACRCASTSPPGGLSPDQVPQLIVLTHDDGVNALSSKLVRAATDNTFNPNGCNVPVTWYTLVKKVHDLNHELATHTVTHTQLYPTYEKMAWDVLGAKDFLVGCGIPAAEVVGFRSPYLVHNPQLRQVLASNGFLYDSSIDELFPSDTSPSAAHRAWPYSMDNGLPQNCNWTIPYGFCLKSERYPGLWELPIIEFQSANGESLSTMDPTAATADALFQQMVSNLRFSLDGNKAPMGIYVHAPWFTADHTAALKKFIAYALSLPDVWFVTARQLVEYMKAPVPKAQMGSFIKCRPADFSSTGTTPCQTYTVKAGDFLYNISSAVGVTVDDLLKANPGLSTTSPVFLGQVLRIPPWDATCTLPSSGSSPAPLSSSPAAATGPPCRTYTVAFGDSLYAVASQFSVTLADLAAANPTIDITRALMAGQVLRIPPWPASCSSGTPAPSPSASSPSPTSSPMPSPAAPASPVPAPATESLRVDFVLQGCDRATFVSSKQTMFVNALAALASISSYQVSVASVVDYSPSNSSRRLLAQGPAVAVAADLLFLQNATATAGTLFLAKQLGLDSAVSAMGLTLVSMNMTILSQQASPAPAGSPSPSASPAAGSPPASTPAGAAGAGDVGSAAGGSGGGKNLGAILGGSLGGGLGGALLIGAVAFYVMRRRRARAQDQRAADGLRVMYAGTAPAAPGIPTVTLHTTIPKGEEASASSTPRSATHRQRNVTPFT